MMKLFLTLILFSICGSVVGQYNFVVNVTSTSLSGKKIYFSIFNNENFIPVRYDSIFIKNDHIRINGQLTQPSSFACFALRDKGEYIMSDFIIDSGENHINLELVDGISKSLKLRSDTKGNRIYNESFDIFNRKAKSYKVNSYYQVPKKIMTEILNEQMKYLERYPDDFGSVLFLYRLGRMDQTLGYARNILTTLSTFSNSVKYSALGKKLYDEKTSLINSIRSAKVGNQAIEFNVKDIDNKLFSNRDLKNQNYLIVFSATWCIPCQIQLPKFKKIYENYKDRGLQVVYFNVDDDVVKWKKHVSSNKLSWINVSERTKPAQNKIPKSFGVNSYPTCLLVGKNGKIIYNSDDGDPELTLLEQKVGQLFK